MPIKRLPANRWSFSSFFKPIIAHLVDFHWVSEQSPFRHGGDVPWVEGVLDSLDWVQLERAVHYRPRTVLPKFAGQMREDWNSLYGFLEVPEPQRFFAGLEPLLQHDGGTYQSFIKGHFLDEKGYNEFLEKHGSQSGGYIAQHVDLYFRNVDGAWWEFYARDEALVDAVRNHLRDTPGLRLTEQLLEKRHL